MKLENSKLKNQLEKKSEDLKNTSEDIADSCFSKLIKNNEIGTSTDPVETRHASTDVTIMCDVSCNTDPVNVQPLYTSAEIGTIPLIPFEKVVNTSHTTLQKVLSNKTAPKTSEDDTNMYINRLKDFLLAEIMSLQLLHSMFDLSLHNDHTQSCSARNEGDYKVCESVNSITPSGYETSSLGNNEVASLNDDLSGINTSFSKHLKKEENSTFIVKTEALIDEDTKPVLEKRTSLVGSFFEEIIESKWLHELDNCQKSACDRVEEINEEIILQKKNVDSEILNLVTEMLHGCDLQKEGKHVVSYL